jgi:hypothetical protein
MSKNMVYEFMSLPPNTKERVLKFVQFGYTLALIDMLRLNKSQDTVDAALDLKKFARTGIDELFVIEKLNELTAKHPANEEE